MKKHFTSFLMLFVALFMVATNANAALNLTIQAMNTTWDGATVPAAPGESFENATKFPNINITPSTYGATIAGSTLLLTSDKGLSQEIDLNTMFYEGEMASDIIVKIGNENITASGVYTLHIPANFIVLNGEGNEAMDLSWTYTNTTEQGGDEEKELTIKSFTINGVNMLAEGAAIDQITTGVPVEILIDPIPEAKMLTLNLDGKAADGTVSTRRVEIYDNPFNKEFVVDPETGSYKGVFAGKTITKFFEGGNYTATITGYNATNTQGASKSWGPVEVKFTGTYVPYKYSDVKIVSVTPEDGSEVTDVTTPIVVTFSAPVETVTCQISEGGQGASLNDLTDITASADKTIWTIKPGKSFWATADTEYMFFIAAKDANGLVVKGNVYDEDKSQYRQTISCYLGLPAVNVLPGTGMVDELYEFSVSDPTGIGLSYTATPMVYDEDGNEVAKVDMNSQVQYDALGRDLNDIPMEEENVLAAKAVFHLNKKIITPGKYTFVIPTASFSMGTEYSSSTNRYMEIEYQVVPMHKVEVEVADYATASFKVSEGHDATVSLTPAADWKLASLTLDGNDVTKDMADNAYTVKNVMADAKLVATYEYANEVEIIETTGVVSIENRDYTISNVEAGIQIENLNEGDAVNVYTANGMSIAKATATKDVMTISVPAGQIYIVKINDKAVKVRH